MNNRSYRTNIAKNGGIFKSEHLNCNGHFSVLGGILYNMDTAESPKWKAKNRLLHFYPKIEGINPGQVVDRLLPLRMRILRFLQYAKRAYLNSAFSFFESKHQSSDDTADY